MKITQQLKLDFSLKIWYNSYSKKENSYEYNR